MSAQKQQNGYSQDKKYIELRFDSLEKQICQLTNSLDKFKDGFYDMREVILQTDLPTIKKAADDFAKFKWQVVGFGAGFLILIEIIVHGLKILGD